MSTEDPTPHLDPAPAQTTRQGQILARLRPAVGGSQDMRRAAIVALNDDGYTDEEITTALQAETARLEATGRLLRNPPGFRNYRERLLQRQEEADRSPVNGWNPPADLPAEHLPAWREEALKQPPHHRDHTNLQPAGECPRCDLLHADLKQQAPDHPLLRALLGDHPRTDLAPDHEEEAAGGPYPAHHGTHPTLLPQGECRRCDAIRAYAQDRTP